MSYCPEIHIFIDEAGDLSDNPKASSYFLMGCVLVSEPDFLRSKMLEIESRPSKSLFFQRHADQIEKIGFHATSNHWDVRNFMISNLYDLPFRAHFVFVDKKKVNIGWEDPKVVYDEYLGLLLKDRLQKHHDKKVVLTFEQNLSRPTPVALEARRIELINLLGSLSQTLIELGYLREVVSCEVSLSDKSDPILHLVDYMNHVVSAYCGGLLNGSFDSSTEQNFLSLSHKIGSIYFPSTGMYSQPRIGKMPKDVLL